MPTNLPNSFEKAYLEIEKGERIKCWFNPKEYTLARSNKWEIKPSRDSKGTVNAQFTSSEPHKLTIDLLFDDSDAHDGDVRSICAKLLEMMEVDQKFASGDKNSARPPMVKFGWGGILTFDAVCEQLSIKYTLFKPNGVPIRALVKLQLTQAEPPGAFKKQNPTTTGFAGVGSHVVREGDSLASISYRAYGDATRWRVIAEENGIDDPFSLRRGTVLSIPRAVE